MVQGDDQRHHSDHIQEHTPNWGSWSSLFSYFCAGAVLCRRPAAGPDVAAVDIPLSGKGRALYPHRMNTAPPHFGFRILSVDAQARLGILQTAHGPIETPTFMTVGTSATVKAMTADAVRSTGCQCVLGNTYHLMLRPGADRINAQGGLHRFMDWPGPILTDSVDFRSCHWLLFEKWTVMV